MIFIEFPEMDKKKFLVNLQNIRNIYPYDKVNTAIDYDSEVRIIAMSYEKIRKILTDLVEDSDELVVAILTEKNDDTSSQQQKL